MHPTDNVLMQIDGLTTAVQALQAENTDLKAQLAEAVPSEVLAEISGKVQALTDSISSPTAP